MLVGGVEFNIESPNQYQLNEIGALNPDQNAEPQKALRSFQEGRSGTVIADGGGVLLLESLESALKRKAKIYCEIAGHSQVCEAHHLVRPKDDGEGLYKSALETLKEANLTVEDIDMINSNATGTLYGDLAEATAMHRLINENRKPQRQPYVTAFKGNLGHAMSAGGVIESIMAIMCMQENAMPAILHLTEPCKDLNFVTEPTKAEINTVLKLGMGAGGVCSTLIYKKYQE